MSESVVDRLRTRAGLFSARVAVTGAGATLTYAELFRRVDALADALYALGLRKGDAVLAYLGNTHEAIETELAVLGSGLVWISLTARLTFAELRGVVVACAPKLVVTSPEGLAKITAGQGVLPLAPMPRVVVTGAHPVASTRSYEGLVASAAEGPRAPRVVIDAEDTARLRYTSGTTGGAKAAVLPHRVYQASLDNLLHELAPVTERDRVLHVAPLTHASGALVYPALHEGATNVLLAHFDAESVLETIERERISIFFTVPTMLSRLVACPRFERHDLSSLRALIYGGAPIPEAQLRAAVAKVGRALVHIYGMTEAPWPITTLQPKEHHLDSRRLLSVGRPTTICEVRIVDGNGAPLPCGQVGEIQVRGRNVMSGYFGDDAATGAVLRDGWLSSGDLGRKDHDGFLFIVGRLKDVIISGGFNVYATEVEAALATDEGVLEVAVMGLPHDEWGEVVAAFVVAKPGALLTPADVETTARRLLAGYKVPRHIELVDELPKNASGKIQKSALQRGTIQRLR